MGAERVVRTGPKCPVTRVTQYIAYLLIYVPGNALFGRIATLAPRAAVRTSRGDGGLGAVIRDE